MKKMLIVLGVMIAFGLVSTELNTASAQGWHSSYHSGGYYGGYCGGYYGGYVSYPVYDWSCYTPYYYNSYCTPYYGGYVRVRF